MALILVVGYGFVCIYNIRLKDKTKRFLSYGFCHWYFVNLLGICLKYGDTQSEFANFDCQFCLFNLGLRTLFIHRAARKRRDEALHKQYLTTTSLRRDITDQTGRNRVGLLCPEN
ncbi:MAG: hypothetical protein ACLSCV_08485 [Acutalibacteraceae bacterium]